MGSGDRRFWPLAAAALAAWLLSSCAAWLPQAQALREHWPADLAPRVELQQVPFFAQREYECGPASLAMLLAADGVAVTPDDLVGKVYVPARQGSLQVEMLAAARTHDRVAWKLAPRLEDVLREVAAGTPVIVLQDYGFWPLRFWHYAVIVGYDRERQEVVLRSGEKKRLVMPWRALEYTWAKSGRWAMLATAPERIAVTATEAGWAAAVAAMERVATRPASRAAYRSLLARWPTSLAGRIGMANVAYADGDLADAEKVLRMAVAQHGESDVALNNLAQVLADQGRRDEALGIVERAIALGGPFRAAAEQTRRQIQARPAASVR